MANIVEEKELTKKTRSKEMEKLTMQLNRETSLRLFLYKNATEHCNIELNNALLITIGKKWKTA